MNYFTNIFTNHLQYIYIYIYLQIGDIAIDY